MKEKLIMFAIGAAWAAGCGVFTFVMSMNNELLNLKKTQEYQEKEINNCVKEDVYQVERQLLMERVKR